jgi:diaminopimelate epimerase
MTSSVRMVPFVKANACGNDFLIIDGSYVPADIADFSRRICERHSGVGADGVEWLFPADDADIDIEARLFNADGSEAEISGNGTRCVAAYLCSDHTDAKRSKQTFAILTGAGVKTCSLTGRNDETYEFETAMGQPRVGSEFGLPLKSGPVSGVPVSMGNPHFVMFAKEFSPQWQKQAAEIGRNHEFKQGVNVELVIVKDKSNVEVRFFERGVGETESSGTGSCASAVAAIATKQVQSPVRVHAPGGVQTVRWESEVFLRGPAQLVCRGEFFG